MVSSMWIVLYLDVDECATNNGNCSHICVNDIPFHHCEKCSIQSNNITCNCQRGYIDLNFNGINCTGKFNYESVIFS